MSRSAGASSMVVTHRRPSAAFTTVIAGTIKSHGDPGLERHHADSQRSGAVGTIVVFDRGKELSDVVDGHTSGDAAPATPTPSRTNR